MKLQAAKILVVDDEPHICDILERLLRSEGYRSSSAYSAEHAMAMLERQEFHLVMSDILMPGMSGIDLLSVITTRFPDIAVLMVTAVDDRDTGLLAVELGAYGYVIKPFSRNEILINVASALERREMSLASKEYERNLADHINMGMGETLQQEELILRLIAVSGYRHGETGTHIRRVGLGASVMAGKLALGWTLQEVEDFRLAAAMHDVGKIGIPDEILTKPGKLTAGEFEIMKKHTQIGSRVLQGFNSKLLKRTQEVAFSHHEKWDGSGYPKKLAGEDIPVSARIVAVCDVYDALIHDRVYRVAYSELDALSLIADAKGKHFDPTILECFFKVLPELRRIRERIPERKGAKQPVRQLADS